MSYDIPDEIKYKEKIIFNLNLKQLLYACVFGFTALLSFNLPIPSTFKLILPSTFALFGLGFIYLNLEDKVKDLYYFHTGVQKAKSTELKAQKIIGITQIENDAIVLSDNNLRAILQVQPINYQLLDDNEKKSVILNYREFLNHLTSSVQVLVIATKPDLHNYFTYTQQKLQETNKELRKLFDDFLLFEQEYLEKNNVLERNYYLVITQQNFSNKLEKKAENFERLAQKVKIIQEKLLACRIKSKRLKTKELIELFEKYAAQNNETNEENTADNKTGEKEEVISNTFLESITPEFEVTQKEAKVNGTYHRIVKTEGYPRKVEDGWLTSFLSANEPYDISLHIHPASINTTLIHLHNQLIRQSSDLHSSVKDGTPNPSLEIKYKDTMKVYENLYKGEEKFFQVSLYIDSKAKSKSELDLLHEKCNANMNSILIIPKSLDYRMADGIKSMLPIGFDVLNVRKDFLTSSLSATFPFLYPVESIKEGIFFAHEKNTGNPLFIDFNSMSNKHFFVLGISGSGKSYTSKFLLMQTLLSQQPKIYILDPNAEYKSLTNALKGEVIELSKNSNSIINLFDLAGEDFGTKMLTLISVFDIITGGLTESQKGVLNDALIQVYKRKNIESDKPTTWNNKPPTFSDLKQVLQEMRDTSLEEGFAIDEKSIEVLINRVKMYSKNGFFGFLDRETKVRLQDNIIDFDLSELPNQVKQLVMFSVLELISREIKKDKLPKVVLIDEGWSLLRSKEAENYILEFIKTSRKYNASIGFITQEIEDLLRSEGGQSILNTTSTKILLRQNSSNLELISKTLALNEKQREYLMRANKGEGLLITEHSKYEFYVTASPKIHSLITTDPNDKQTYSNQSHYLEKAKIQIDINRGFYKVNELTEDQADQLRKNGYVHWRSLCLNEKGPVIYLVKTQSNESEEHALVCWAIADELRKRGYKPHVNPTVKADVEVEINKKKIAFEVETGEYLRFNGAEKLKERFESRLKNFDRVVIVVTDRLKQGPYQRITRVKTVTRTQVFSVIDELK